MYPAKIKAKNKKIPRNIFFIVVVICCAQRYVIFDCNLYVLLYEKAIFTSYLQNIIYYGNKKTFQYKKVDRRK